MKDIKSRMEKLRVDAEDCLLISRLSTVPEKRAVFENASGYREPALPAGFLLPYPIRVTYPIRVICVHTKKAAPERPVTFIAMAAGR